MLAAITADARASRQAASLALRFVILTAARGAEVQQMRWADMDLSTATWTVRPETHKRRKMHRVPLSSAALDVLTEARRLSNGDGLVFVSSKGKALVSDAPRRIMDRLDVPDVNGKRATVPETWAQRSTAHSASLLASAGSRYDVQSGRARQRTRTANGPQETRVRVVRARQRLAQERYGVAQGSHQLPGAHYLPRAGRPCGSTPCRATCGRRAATVL